MQNTLKSMKIILGGSMHELANKIYIEGHIRLGDSQVL